MRFHTRVMNSGRYRLYWLQFEKMDVRFNMSGSELRRDREIVLAAVQQTACALQYASAGIKSMRFYVIAVQQNFWTLRLAST